MDTAKAIAVEVTHEGTAWDYLYFKKEPTLKTLPVITISTTSGTGSQTTPCAVITKLDENNKSALWHSNLFVKTAIVDPELMLTVPPSTTAQTGFDTFAHNFEAYISNDSNGISELFALEGIRLVINYLPDAISDGNNVEARESMALADTLGGLAISSAHVTLPHGIGMQISGHCPHVTHGQSLAVLYPEFTRFTFASSVEKFAKVARMFNPELIEVSDDVAATKCCVEVDEFLKNIGLWISLKDLGISIEKLKEIANDGQVLSDYLNNPRIATIEEMNTILLNCYDR